ncbi:UpxY family transcription antiterminator [Mucilaginibacter sp. HMF5004]|uniref:UpxY family transcription antiterminator n=1 Tax=Mucilaginibacter rivuli TaxID=2857527 RepID=UPI001C6053C8|nr:UpxY family transcription antiterminator [Mucilaginibacter rivuli]MBW4890078.1 UpxY family transcription antiterminator [Mucilaginibacter rivuli]
MLSTQNTYSWYPVYTNPRAEKKAFDQLNKKGIETYFPTQKTLKQWSDRKKWVEEPLFNSYLFVKISEKEYTDVLQTNGVCRFVYFSGKASFIPEQQINNIKLLTSNAIPFEIIDPGYKKGEKVRVKTGPMQGLTGELIDFRLQKKMLIRLEHISHALLVEIPMAFIEPYF